MNRRRWTLETYLTQLIGRKVTKVICCEPGCELDSPAQFTMEMDDHRTYELYGRENLGITGLRHNTTAFCEEVFTAATRNRQPVVFADGETIRFYEPGQAAK